MTFPVVLAVYAFAAAQPGQRITVPLDGEWQIEDSLEADAIPRQWTHRVAVPGLANLAQPGFVAVDQFDSKEVIANRVQKGSLPESALVHNSAGVSRQPRNYFWYARSFQVSERRQRAVLRINKAQFGTAVWLNGKKIGEYPGCFSASYFDVTGAINWTGDNRLIVRIGAHPAVLPETYPTGSDFEKNRWTPGIYDSVSLLLMNNPVIETVQVAPRISPPSVLIETKVANYGSSPAGTVIAHRVREWKSKREVAASAGEKITLAPGETRTIRQTIPIAGGKLWSPESPFLYTVESSTAGDQVTTRFGLREFRFDTATRRAYLNGKVYFLRGSNITLHRFFEDPDAGGLAWNDAWVRKLLGELPKKMNWNAFRFCIGPVPDRWMEIADEAGLLIQNEFFIWTGHPNWGRKYSRSWDEAQLISQYKDWMRDNWNHPSQAIWDANNESFDPVFREKVIPAVRPLDLSNRPWENSYNLPAGPDDPVEDHPYLHQRNQNGRTEFRMTDLERMNGSGRALSTPSAHAMVLNEYGWLWLNRDGSPTLLTDKVYELLLGKEATGAQRLELWSYLLAGKTEFWRAQRNHAGVLHFVYLTSCYAGAYTCDNFKDLKTLTLDPTFADYVRESFKPLGVYINFFQAQLKAGQQRTFTVMMTNDEDREVRGTLTLSLAGERTRQPFAIPAHGAETLLIQMVVPAKTGEALLEAAALEDGKAEPTRSRRKLTISAN